MENHWLYIIISFIIGNLSGGLLNWLKLSQEIKKFFKVDLYKIDEKYVGHNSNPRFGFSFTEPLNWDRFDPDNGDGYKYIFPDNEKIYFSISGSYNVFEFTDVQEYSEWLKNALIEEKNVEITVDRQSGRMLIDYVDENSISRENVKAWKLKYNKTIHNDKLTAIHVCALYDNTLFSIYCQAPKNKFPRFEDFFTQIITSFKILGNHSSLFARNSH